MSWEPSISFEDEVHRVHGLRATFDDFCEQHENSLKEMRPQNRNLQFDSDDGEDIDSETLKADALDQIELQAYVRSLGHREKPQRRWNENEESSDHDTDYEITQIIRQSGQERELPNYKMNSKTTHRSGVDVDKIPVAGVRNLYITDDHFKFENPYTITLPEKNNDVEGAAGNTSTESDVNSRGSPRLSRLPVISLAEEKYPLIDKSSVRKKENSTYEYKLRKMKIGKKKSSTDTSSNSSNIHTDNFVENSRLYKEPTFGVHGEKFISPKACYFAKSRRIL